MNFAIARYDLVIADNNDRRWEYVGLLLDVNGHTLTYRTPDDAKQFVGVMNGVASFWQHGKCRYAIAPANG